jgi:N-acetylglucosamine-6-phosphate deacetylase
MMLCVVHAQIYTPAQVIDDGVVIVADGRIISVEPAGQTPLPENAHILDAAGYTLVPGFIDLQVNGGFGFDFTRDPATIWTVAAQLPRFGVTTFLPTIVTSPMATVQAAQLVIEKGPPAGFEGAWPLGLHLEGPFLNPAKKGAHNPDYMRRPSLQDVVNWSPDNGVRLVTLAPELPGAPKLIQALTGRGVAVSAGHSTATFDEAILGFDAGIGYGTHLFNAMPAMHHREPGLAGALLADERITVGLIPDGIHVHPALVRLVWELAGERLNLVTDAMAALGMPAGTYQLGDMIANVDSVSARLPDGTLAGCTIPMNAALENLIAYTGCSLGEALSTITTIPAGLLGINKGRIGPGYDADLVLLTPDRQVQLAIVAGRIVYEKTE